MYGPYAVTSSRRATIAWTLAAKSFVHKDIVHRLFKFVCELGFELWGLKGLIFRLAAESSQQNPSRLEEVDDETGPAV